MNSSYLIWGPPDDTDFGDITFAELLYNSLSKKSPSDILLIEELTGEEISREKFLQSTVKLAVILKELGISQGDTIGLITPNTWKFLVSTLAALFLGVTFTPINPASSKDELCHFLNLSQPKVLFISRNVLDRVREIKHELNFLKYIIILDTKDVQDEELAFDELLSREVNCKIFQMQKKSTKEAIILYSSGTTGLPKGVVLSQENALYAMKNCCHPDFMGINEECVLLAILPLFHIFGLLSTFSFLWIGKRVIISEKFKPDRFLKSIQDYKVSYLIVVPPLLLFLAKSPMVDDYDLSSVMHIFCGAAPLSKEVENLVSERFKVPIRQLYGLSECVAISIMPPNISKPGSTGKVVIGHLSKVVDPQTGTILRPSTTGEICFKGPCVMQGYKNNEDATEKIIDEDGYLHTGDIGYFDEDGYLFVVDRIKDIMKYKAFQVQPAYLEDILMKHPAIKDVAVVGKPDEKCGELPTAFVVRQSNVEVTEQDIIDYVAGRVSAEKQLHGGVIFKEELPRSSSGKLLKRELKKWLV